MELCSLSSSLSSVESSNSESVDSNNEDEAALAVFAALTAAQSMITGNKVCAAGGLLPGKSANLKRNWLSRHD